LQKLRRGEAYCDIFEVSVVFVFFSFVFFVFFVFVVVVSCEPPSRANTGMASEEAKAAVNNRLNNFFMTCVLLRE
jgi:hypothetical protein